MPSISAANSAVQGIQQQQQALTSAAKRLQETPLEDSADQIVQLIGSSNGVAANVQTLQLIDRSFGIVIDVVV